MTEKQDAPVLAAPCGIYCGACRHYLAREKGLLEEKKLKHGCRGCRAQDKKCSWIKRDCAQVRKKQVTFCFECAAFPCENLETLDQRHRREEGISLIDNVVRIREIGAEQWVAEQKRASTCPVCGGAVCITDRTCYDCGRAII